jgi:preprotein translocase subunit SecE
VNRESKRMQRQDQTEADGSPSAPRSADASAKRPAKKRTSPIQFVREIRDELRQVAWPSRAEMVNYTTIVFATLVFMTALIFLLNFAFGKGVLFMFQK